jgi:small subunit ribosomal protein S7
MPRKYKSTEIHLKPDPRYGSPVLSKFINTCMECGKKSIASASVYGALETLKQRFPEMQPLDVFIEAVENVKPKVEVKSKRVGGANYQVPVDVNPRRKQYLAFTWVIEAARARKGRPFADCLADELTDAFKREGAACRKREEVHRMADANRAFAHFAW